MKKAKITGTKKLSLRKDLYTDEVTDYFTPDDTFYVDDSQILYDYKNDPFYSAKNKFGDEGFVITKGVIFVEEEKRHGKYTQNSAKIHRSC